MRSSSSGTGSTRAVRARLSRPKAAAGEINSRAGGRWKSSSVSGAPRVDWLVYFCTTVRPGNGNAPPQHRRSSERWDVQRLARAIGYLAASDAPCARDRPFSWDSEHTVRTAWSFHGHAAGCVASMGSGFPATSTTRSRCGVRILRRGRRGNERRGTECGVRMGCKVVGSHNALANHAIPRTSFERLTFHPLSPLPPRPRNVDRFNRPRLHTQAPPNAPSFIRVRRHRAEQPCLA